MLNILSVKWRPFCLGLDVSQMQQMENAYNLLDCLDGVVMQVVIEYCIPGGVYDSS